MSNGSSPRGRGTEFEISGGVRRVRFIPAWAGNRRSVSSEAPPASVHPRVGGEQGIKPDRGRDRNGSSPRGRGTAGLTVRSAARWRFIPAWAGNRAPRPPSRSLRSVHPRVGGEQTLAVQAALYGVGSSPRGRGTATVGRINCPDRRFIPAWAGNRAPMAIAPRA